MGKDLWDEAIKALETTNTIQRGERKKLFPAQLTSFNQCAEGASARRLLALTGKEIKLIDFRFPIPGLSSHMIMLTGNGFEVANKFNTKRSKISLEEVLEIIGEEKRSVIVVSGMNIIISELDKIAQHHVS